jgi:DUF1365 family protein
MVTDAGLFVGTLRHRRFTPVPHEFTYSTLMAWLDVDRLAELMRASPFTSYNRWNVASFDDRDHLGDLPGSLRQRLAADAARHGIDLPEGRILLLGHLRHFGYVFNPLSLFYVFDDTDQLRCVLAEVRNTFGGTHRHWLRPDGQAAVFRATTDKSLYVSPFMPVDAAYEFTLALPVDRLGVHIRVTRAGSALFDATLSLERRPWTAAEIHRQLLRHPLMTARVMAAIHWQALRLWWKGVPLVARRTPTGVGERAAWPLDGAAPGPAEP